jgi:hypothetical protein
MESVPVLVFILSETCKPRVMMLGMTGHFLLWTLETGHQHPLLAFPQVATPTRKLMTDYGQRHLLDEIVMHERQR